MAKNEAEEYDIKVHGPGFITLMGDIKSDNGETVLIRHRRHSSSKYQIKSIPKQKIAAFYNGGIGEQSKIVYHDERAIPLRIKKGSIEGNDTKHPGFVKAKDADGQALYINSKFLDAVTTSDVEAPQSSGMKKKKSKSKKKE